MEKIVVKTEWIVGWSTKQSNTNVRTTTNKFGEFEYMQAYCKYIKLSNKHNVIYCYLNMRKEYTDGSVEITPIYHV